MRHYNRFIILSTLFISNSAFALEYFIDGLAWRATETNNWAYINSETLPRQTINYKTIDTSVHGMPCFPIPVFIVKQLIRPPV
jgi:hypothetical protein